MIGDRELLRRSSRRDYRAFAVLFDQHAAAVFRYALSLSRDPDDAQDVVQETFMTAWKRVADIHLIGDSLLPWLLVTARNHGANLSRSKQIRAASPLDSVDASVTDSTLDRLENAEELRWIFDAVEQLGETDRRLVELCLYEGRDYYEAAGLLGLSVGVVTKRIHRTRAKLRTERDLRQGEVPA